MDWIAIIFTIFIAVIVDLISHLIISNREVKKLKTESARFEKDWQIFRQDMDAAAKQIYNDKYQRWVIED